MTTYIYLNTYSKGYLYVGSHTWNGPEGELDPKYHGSSTIAKLYNWLPIKEEILEVVPNDRRLIAEREWIEKYASLYGIADFVIYKAKSLAWVSKFKQHGLVINAHANSCIQALEAARTPDALRKRYKSRISSGRESWSAAVSAMHKKESREKSRLTYKQRGHRPTEATIASHTKESIAKNMESRKRSARHILVDGTSYLLMDAGIHIGCCFKTVYNLWKSLGEEEEIVYRGHKLRKVIV